MDHLLAIIKLFWLFTILTFTSGLIVLLDSWKSLLPPEFVCLSLLYHCIVLLVAHQAPLL